MVYLSHCGAHQLPGSFNIRNTPPSRLAKLGSRLAGRGPAGRARAALIGRKRPEGNFREYRHSRVPLSGIRRQRGMWLPLRAASQHTLSSGRPGWVVGCGWGRGWTESRVVRMRVREGLDSKIPFPDSAPGSLPTSPSAPPPRGLRLKEHPGRGPSSPEAAYTETPKF